MKAERISFQANDGRIGIGFVCGDIRRAWLFKPEHRDEAEQKLAEALKELNG